MFEKLSPEYQVNKRVRSFLDHSATQNNVAVANARLLFRYSDDKSFVHLYEGGRYVKTLSVRSILEFFGQDYTEQHQQAVEDYLRKTASSENIKLTELIVVICDVKGTLGAHLYEGSKYRKKISTLNLVTHFLSPKNE